MDGLNARHAHEFSLVRERPYLWTMVGSRYPLWIEFVLAPSGNRMSMRARLPEPCIHIGDLVFEWSSLLQVPSALTRSPLSRDDARARRMWMRGCASSFARSTRSNGFFGFDLI